MCSQDVSQVSQTCTPLSSEKAPFPLVFTVQNYEGKNLPGINARSQPVSQPIQSRVKKYDLRTQGVSPCLCQAVKLCFFLYSRTRKASDRVSASGDHHCSSIASYANATCSRRRFPNHHQNGSRHFNCSQSLPGLFQPRLKSFLFFPSALVRGLIYLSTRIVVAFTGAGTATNVERIPNPAWEKERRDEKKTSTFRSVRFHLIDNRLLRERKGSNVRRVSAHARTERPLSQRFLRVYGDHHNLVLSGRIENAQK